MVDLAVRLVPASLKRRHLTACSTSMFDKRRFALAFAAWRSEWLVMRVPRNLRTLLLRSLRTLPRRREPCHWGCDG